jgi:hypothetical protein
VHKKAFHLGNVSLVYAALGTKNSDDGQLPDDLLHNV